MYLNISVDQSFYEGKFIKIKVSGEYCDQGWVEDEVYITKEMLQEVLGITEDNTTIWL